MLSTFNRCLGLAILVLLPLVALGDPPPDAQPESIMTREAIVVISKSRKVVAAYSVATAKWSRIELEVPLDARINLTMAKELVAFQTGSKVYAFSARNGAWSRLDLPKDSTATFVLDEAKIWVTDRESLYVFGIHSTDWAGFDAASGDLIVPKPDQGGN